MSSTAAFDEIVARHRNQVLRVCRAILRDEHLGADAAQETFLRLWQSMGHGKTAEPQSLFIRRVAVNASLDLARRRKVQREIDDRLLERSRTDDLVEGVGPEEKTASDEMRRRFEQALITLPEGQRSVFVLRHEGGLTLAEVAQALGVALPTVKTQFARACLKLQKSLAAFGPTAKRNEE